MCGKSATFQANSNVISNKIPYKVMMGPARMEGGRPRSSCAPQGYGMPHPCGGRMALGSILK